MATILRSSLRFSSKTCQCRALSLFSPKFNPEENVDKLTHTGQVWNKDDIRRMRFIGKDKLINKKFAIDLVAKDPIVVVEGRSVFSHSGGALGHPRVFINLDKPEPGVCGYSGRRFIQAKYYNKAEHGPSITYEQYLEEMGIEEN
ncbi:hypothetical protein CHS0354_039200 [Potamilus streckersoni]|uniref:Zinc finger CHCC-type domain-containing protein n=1 Tax=Potamilus streckersoni TaxID=2493646 RepID=A0AAE0TDF7_9BIVA|nr:hypothetical protein CHS0354_039200 [Potamilus streckersoni]